MCVFAQIGQLVGLDSNTLAFAENSTAHDPLGAADGAQIAAGMNASPWHGGALGEPGPELEPERGLKAGVGDWRVTARLSGGRWRLLAAQSTRAQAVPSATAAHSSSAATPPTRVMRRPTTVAPRT